MLSKVGVPLGRFFVWTTDLIKCVISMSRAHCEAGVRAEKQECPGDDPALDAELQTGLEDLMTLGYVCRDSWWLSPAFARFGHDWWDERAMALDDAW